MTPEQLQKLERYRAFLSSDPGNLALLAEVLPLLTLSGQLDEAESVLTNALQAAPGSAEIRFHQGSLSLVRRRYGAALNVFEELLTEGVDHPGVIYNAAYASLHLGKPDIALSYLERIPDAERVENVVDADKLEARCRHHLEDLDGAIRLLSLSLERNRDDAEALGLMALIAADDGQDTLARRTAERCLALDPANEEALLALGSIALESRDSAAALEQFGAIVTHNPEHGRAWSGLAFAQVIEVQLDDARQSFQNAVRFMPNHIGTWQGLAWLQILNKDWAGAEASLAAAMALNRNVAETHGTLAVLSILTGKLEASELMIRRALGFDVNSPSGLYAKSLLAMRRQQPHLGMDELLHQVSQSMGLTGSDAIGALVKETVAKLNSRKGEKT